MHQTRKVNRWDFSVKAYIGVDSKTMLIHSDVTTPANVHDAVVLGDLLHGDENRVRGESAYTGKGDVIAEHAPRANNAHYVLVSCASQNFRLSSVIPLIYAFAGNGRSYHISTKWRPVARIAR